MLSQWLPEFSTTLPAGFELLPSYFLFLCTHPQCLWLSNTSHDESFIFYLPFHVYPATFKLPKKNASPISQPTAPTNPNESICQQILALLSLSVWCDQTLGIWVTWEVLWACWAPLSSICEYNKLFHMSLLVWFSQLYWRSLRNPQGGLTPPFTAQ